MSASDKKKARKQQQMDLLTVKQKSQQQEAKKTKIATISFLALMLAILVAGVAILANQGITRAAEAKKNTMAKSTVAATVGDYDINSVEFSYYYVDCFNEQYSTWSEQYGDYLSTMLEIMNLDMEKPLDQQMFEEDTNTTWSDHFVESAVEKIHNNYTLYDAAVKAGYELPEEDLENIDAQINSLQFYAQIYGYSDETSYLRAVYGYGAAADSYREYCIRSKIADLYYDKYSDELTLADSDLEAYDKEHALDYNGYNYSSIYLSYQDFLQGGTEGEDGTKTYSDAEKDAAREAVKEAAEKVAEATTLEEMDAAIAELELKQTASSANTGILYSAIDGKIRDWVTDESRQENDITLIENTAKETDSDGNEKEVINGYYVLLFQSMTDNNVPMDNVRHILISFETDDEDEEHHEVTEEEKAAALDRAEALLEDWKSGEATEESFIALVEENTGDSGSATTGGLYENIHINSSYVPNFKNWAIDESRKAGDTGIVESDYGYHIMYYVGESDTTYRASMVHDDLHDAKLDEWYQALLAAVEVQKADLSLVNLGLVSGS